MTTTHRFQGPVTRPCEERFGGVARCALPYVNDLHYSDDRHPFTVSEGGSSCGWPRQIGADAGARCGLTVTSVVHVAPAEWGKGRVRPPDEDAEARAEARAEAGRVPTLDEAREARSDSAWKVAAEALSGAARDTVESGPWPVRQFWLPGAYRDTEQEDALWEVLRALTLIGCEWECSATVEGDGRWVLVTWGQYMGLARTVVADEIASEYDEG